MMKYSRGEETKAEVRRQSWLTGLTAEGPGRTRSGGRREARPRAHRGPTGPARPATHSSRVAPSARPQRRAPQAPGRPLKPRALSWGPTGDRACEPSELLETPGAAFTGSWVADP